jgi:hypothetical protein
MKRHVLRHSARVVVGIAAVMATSAQASPWALPKELALDAGPLLAQGPAFDLVVETSVDSPGSERRVSGAPYCADAVHETIQPLLDANGQPGNRIVRQTRTRLCRDGEGRTRQEVERSGSRQVILRDPVARETWVLDPQRKTARRAGMTFASSDGAAAALAESSHWQDYAERMREWARGLVERPRAGAGAARAPDPPTAPIPPMPAPAELVTIERQAREAASQMERDVEVRVLRLQRLGDASATPAPLPPPAPPVVSWTASTLAPRGEGTTTSLGSKDIEGVRAHGERTTWTIEAGKIGNERAIQIVREVWTSPELMLTLAVRDFDPRRGESLYRLTNLKRGEPDASLMKVPSDYERRGSSRAAVPRAASGGG